MPLTVNEICGMLRSRQTPMMSPFCRLCCVVRTTRGLPAVSNTRRTNVQLWTFLLTHTDDLLANHVSSYKIGILTHFLEIPSPGKSPALWVKAKVRTAPKEGWVPPLTKPFGTYSNRYYHNVVFRWQTRLPRCPPASFLPPYPPTTYAAVGNTECGVHLLYVCTFSITPALSHTTPSAYLIDAHDEHINCYTTPTTYAAVGNTECAVHLLYLCKFSITPALSHTTPSAYLIASAMSTLIAIPLPRRRLVILSAHPE